MLDHRSHLGDVRVHRAGVARAVGEQHAVRRDRIDLGGRGVVRQHRHGRAGRLQQPHDRGLGAVVEHDDVTARVGRRHAVELARDLVGEQAARPSAARPRAARAPRARVTPSPQATREHRPAVAQMAHERARVEARERDDAALAQPVEQALPPVRRVVARLVAEQRGGLHAARLGDVVLDAVVADHRRREGEYLAREARIGERLLVAGHGGREDGLADGGAGRADADAGPVRCRPRGTARRRSCRHRGRACAALRPPASVSRQRPCSSRPRNAQLRLRECRSSSPTTQRSRRSQSARSASAPTAILGRSSPKARAGPGGHALDDQLERDDARLDEAGDERREGGLEADHAVRRGRERHFLLGRVVRRVVGRDAVDRAVAEALDERLAVRLGGQGRAHLEARGVQREHLLVGQ